MFASLGRQAFEAIFKRKATFFACVAVSAFTFEVVFEKVTDSIFETANEGMLLHHNKHQYGKWVDEEP